MIPFRCKSEAITYFKKSMLYNVALPRDSCMFPAQFQFQKWKCTSIWSDLVATIWSESQGYMGTKVQVDRNLEERTWF
jgi:hypothetical protein